MKIDGFNKFQPIDRPGKTKKTDQPFADVVQNSMNNTDKVQISSGSPEVGILQQASLNQSPASLGLNRGSLESIASQVLQQPESISKRVDEIKKLIAEGGYEAYFNSINTESVADRVIRSGILFDADEV